MTTELTREDLEEQYEGYCELVNGLQELVVEYSGDADGFYCNNPIELLGDVRDIIESEKIRAIGCTHTLTLV